MVCMNTLLESVTAYLALMISIGMNPATINQNIKTLDFLPFLLCLLVDSRAKQVTSES